MTYEIGRNAGMVWDYLVDTEEAAAAAIARGTGLTQRQVDRAIGWLAREGKITAAKKKNVEVLSLSEEALV